MPVDEPEIEFCRDSQLFSTTTKVVSDFFSTVKRPVNRYEAVEFWCALSSGEKGMYFNQMIDYLDELFEWAEMPRYW